MLTLREEQLDAFGRMVADQFEVRIAKYLASTYPDKMRDSSDADVRETIRKGIERAAAYGLSAEQDVARFIDLMYRVSFDFDSRPETPWVAPTLRSIASSPHERMDVVYAKFLESCQ